ncbi:MAG: hypothetical protein MK033_01215 [Candidatus Caenarcaniphilales bacterium]|nr:hypothetical protein [Candidatus Caenarcaniphilales bacterium]
MQLFLGILKFFIKKVVSFVIIIALVYFLWNLFSHREDKRKFVISVDHISGLSRGAPVYLGGAKVGKVLKIFPVANLDKVAIEGIITQKGLVIDKNDLQARIITDVEGGGGQVLEITQFHLISSSKNNKQNSQVAYITKYASRLLLDTLQMTKDFANESIAYLNRQETLEYKQKLEESVGNTVRSIEYGLIEDDIKNNMRDINNKIKDVEQSKEENPNQVTEALADQLEAIKNTLSSFNTVSDVYKD